MSHDAREGMPFIEVAGTPYEVGAQLGRRAAAIVHGFLATTHAWASVMEFRRDDRVLAARALVESRFPRYWQELQGLATGLRLPFDDVFAWNCRGDVWAMAPDGCTTVQLPGPRPVLAHNEDGQAGLRPGCALALVRSEGGRAFTAFVYPASLPGHAFAVTETGLVQTVNNIRSQRAGAGVPRMVLARGVLDCDDIDAAVGLVAGVERAGGFHLSLAQAGDPRLVSVEFTHAGCSVETVSRPQCHANHLVHPRMAQEEQVVTASSRSRQARGEAMLRDSDGRHLDPLAILWDRTRPALPIYRAQPDDPDDENTLATAVFEIGADDVAWVVYDRAGAPPRFAAKSGLGPSHCRSGPASDRLEEVK